MARDRRPRWTTGGGSWRGRAAHASCAWRRRDGAVGGGSSVRVEAVRRRREWRRLGSARGCAVSAGAGVAGLGWLGGGLPASLQRCGPGHVPPAGPRQGGCGACGERRWSPACSVRLARQCPRGDGDRQSGRRGWWWWRPWLAVNWACGGCGQLGAGRNLARRTDTGDALGAVFLLRTLSRHPSLLRWWILRVKTLPSSGGWRWRSFASCSS